MNAPELIIPATLALGSLLPNGDRYFARIRGPEGDYGVALPPIAVRAHPATPWHTKLARRLCLGAAFQRRLPVRLPQVE